MCHAHDVSHTWRTEVDKQNHLHPCKRSTSCSALHKCGRGTCVGCPEDIVLLGSWRHCFLCFLGGNWKSSSEGPHDPTVQSFGALSSSCIQLSCPRSTLKKIRLEWWLVINPLAISNSFTIPTISLLNSFSSLCLILSQVSLHVCYIISFKLISFISQCLSFKSPYVCKDFILIEFILNSSVLLKPCLFVSVF